MKLQVQGLAVALLLTCALTAVPQQIHAAPISMPAGVTEADLKPDFPQPYIVKKGDTLWDIAAHFFKDPEKWMKIWERNLYITNPDLIYPGNKIWFNPEQKATGGLSTIRPRPEIIIKPVEHLEPKIDPHLLLTALARQDFIQPKAIKGVGYIVNSSDQRINYGANDHLYLKFDNAAPSEGDVFDVFRTGDPVRDPHTGKLVGYLINDLGQIEVTSHSGDIYRGVVVNSFEEMSRGDRLKPAHVVSTRIIPEYPKIPLAGEVMYLRNDASEAGQHQIIGINLGLRDHLRAGTVLSIHRAGRVVQDPVTGKPVRLPEEKIGEVIVLVPQQDASIALVTESTNPINIGDSVRNQAHP
jgi:LysM domain